MENPFNDSTQAGGNMDQEVLYQKLKEGQQKKVSAMVIRTFEKFVAPGYSPQGIEEFIKYASPDKLIDRSKKNYLILAAWIGMEPVGVVEIRDYRHISLFFVPAEHQGHGIGKKLHERALQICRKMKPGLQSISVFSSPFAVPIYESLGFHSTGPEQYEHGMYFIPMVLEIKPG